MTPMNAATTSSTNRVESDYERRIALATPGDTARGLFFNGVLAAVVTFGGEPALKRCHSLLNDKRFERRFIDFSSYPVSDFLRMALAATQVLSAQLGGAETTQRRLGMQATRDFLGSMAGRTLLLLSGSSPKRVIGNLASGYRSAVSYGERTVTLLGETRRPRRRETRLHAPALQRGRPAGAARVRPGQAPPGPRHPAGAAGLRVRAVLGVAPRPPASPREAPAGGKRFGTSPDSTLELSP